MSMTEYLGKDILGRLDRPEVAEEFINKSQVGNAEKRGVIEIVATLYAAQKTRDAAIQVRQTMDDISVVLQRNLNENAERITTAMDKHAAALVKAANASEKYARGLERATWALCLATAALVLVELIPRFLGHE